MARGDKLHFPSPALPVSGSMGIISALNNLGTPMYNYDVKVGIFVIRSNPKLLNSIATSSFHKHLSMHTPRFSKSFLGGQGRQLVCVSFFAHSPFALHCCWPC